MKEIGEARKIEKYLLHLEGKPIDQAIMIKDLLNKGWTQEKLAEHIGWSQSKISFKLKLLDLHPKLQERAQRGELRPSVAWNLANMPRVIQEKYIDMPEIKLKDVRAERRRLAITDEIMEVLNEPLPNKSKHVIICPKCGHEFLKEVK